MEKIKKLTRRSFLSGATAAAATAAIPTAVRATNANGSNLLRVWSCGGLAEAFMPANEAFKNKFGVEIAYTGAFAAALGKSLFGSATTEVFAGRVLGFAKWSYS